MEYIFDSLADFSFYPSSIAFCTAVPLANYNALLQKYNGHVGHLPVMCLPLQAADGATHHVITDIIGEEPDLGVENLMGSGLIAGETSRAYDDIFTLTLVVGRTVGIGDLFQPRHQQQHRFIEPDSADSCL